MIKGSKMTLKQRKNLSIAHKGQIPWSKGIKIWKNKIPPRLGKHHSEISKQKMSFARKGKFHSKKTKKKISLALVGEKNPMYGKHPTSWSKGKKLPQFSGKNSYHWKGGRVKKKGYIFIYKPNHPYANCKYVREHRLVVEMQIGRYIKSPECTHHINGKKDDNRPKNLMLFINYSTHQRFHKNPNSVKPKEIIFDGRKLQAPKHSF